MLKSDELLNCLNSKLSNIDDIEDLKVAISEACTNAIKHSLEDRFTIIYTMIENGLTIEIENEIDGRSEKYGRETKRP